MSKTLYKLKNPEFFGIKPDVQVTIDLYDGEYLFLNIASHEWYVSSIEAGKRKFKRMHLNGRKPIWEKVG